MRARDHASEKLDVGPFACRTLAYAGFRQTGEPQPGKQTKRTACFSVICVCVFLLLDTHIALRREIDLASTSAGTITGNSYDTGPAYGLALTGQHAPLSHSIEPIHRLPTEPKSKSGTAIATECIAPSKITIFGHMLGNVSLSLTEHPYHGRRRPSAVRAAQEANDVWQEPPCCL